MPVLPAPETPPAVVPVPPEVFVLFDGAVPAHVDVAHLLEGTLSTRFNRVQMVPLDQAAAIVEAGSSPGRDGGSRQSERYAVAVGFEAATFAVTHLRTPTIFCQVFNFGELLDGGKQRWGVASVPPLELQLMAWKLLDPALERVGLIVGEGHDDLVNEALEAGRKLSISVRYERSSSDRQTLYHFRRLARDVDGIWLLPDNRILSPSVIAELLSDAEARRLQVTAINTPSLPRGVLMTARATPADVAETVSRVLARVIDADTAGLPLITPLTEVAVDVNLGTAVLLGLDVLEPSWSVSRYSSAAGESHLPLPKNAR